MAGHARVAAAARRHRRDDDLVAGRDVAGAPSPTDSTSPAASWPSTTGNGVPGPPLIDVRSRWHSLQCVTLHPHLPGPRLRDLQVVDDVERSVFASVSSAVALRPAGY
jgi:hypothetical protein